MKYKLFTLLIISVFLISFTSAWETSYFANNNSQRTLNDSGQGGATLIVSGVWETCILMNITPTNYSQLDVYPYAWMPFWYPHATIRIRDTSLNIIEELNTSTHIGSFQDYVRTNKFYTDGNYNFCLRHFNTTDSNAQFEAPTSPSQYSFTQITGGAAQVSFNIVYPSLNSTLNFTGNQNITRYLLVPQNVYLTNAFLNLTGTNSSGTTLSGRIAGDTCYATPSGTTLSPCADSSAYIDTNDGNFNTYEAFSPFSLPYLKNYTGLGNVSSANITTKATAYSTGIVATYYFNYTNNTYVVLGNITCTTASCTNTSTETYRIPADGLRDTISISIYTDTSSNTRLYENMLNWTGISYPSNLKIFVNSTEAYSYLGSLSNSTRTSNLAPYINSFLNLCTYVNGLCPVPLNFHSDSSGILTYFDLLFNNFGVSELGQNYSNTTYETKSETFTYNFTYDINQYSLTSATLFYGGTPYTGTVSGNAPTYGVTRTIDIPLASSDNQNYSFYWTLNLTNSSGVNQFSTAPINQTVRQINFQICNITYPTAYVNYTFKDEYSLANVNATVDLSTWTYYLGSGGVSKSYIFSNTTQNPSYSFCFGPANLSLNVLLQYFQYSNSVSPQRQYYFSGTLTNTTTNTVLYLLNYSYGQYTTIVVQDGYSRSISDVTVQVYRQFNGVWTLLTQSATDSAGASTFWLNPNYDHQIVMSKTGYTTTTSVIRPTQSVYTLIIQGGGVSSTNYSFKGLNWNAYPRLTQLLEPNTNYVFGFNLTSTINPVTSCKIELRNASLYIVGSAEATATNGYNCTVTLTQDTGENSMIYGYYYIDMGQGYGLLKANDAWIVENVTVINWNLAQTLREFFSDSNPEFGTSSNRQEFSRIVIYIFLMALIIGSFTYYTGYDFAQPGGALILLWGLVTIGSFVGVFEIRGLGSFEFFNKYAIFFIVSFITWGFILDNWRRNST